MSTKKSNIKLVLGDCLEKIKEIEDESVHAVICDPPYHLTSVVKRFSKGEPEHTKTAQDIKNRSTPVARLARGFMGKSWDGGDIAFRTDIWKECFRVLKPGGYLLSFSSVRTYHKMATALEKSNFEIRNMIEWIYFTGFPKSHNVGKSYDQKMGNERKVVGTKKAGMGSGKSFGMLQTEGTNSSKNTAREVPLEVGESEWEGFGTDIKPAHEPICMARKPLSESTVVNNVIKYGTGAINIDGTRIPGEDTRGITGGAIEGFGWGTKEGAIAGSELGRFPANIVVTDDALGKNSKYFNIDKWAEHNGLIQVPKPSSKERIVDGKRSTHPTIKPLQLMKYLIELVTKPGQVVCDPFLGSGTTGVACKQMGRDFIGIEKDEEYFKLAELRINKDETNL